MVQLEKIIKLSLFKYILTLVKMYQSEEQPYLQQYSNLMERNNEQDDSESEYEGAEIDKNENLTTYDVALQKYLGKSKNTRKYLSDMKEDFKKMEKSLNNVLGKMLNLFLFFKVFNSYDFL